MKIPSVSGIVARAIIAMGFTALAACQGAGPVPGSEPAGVIATAPPPAAVETTKTDVLTEQQCDCPEPVSCPPVTAPKHKDCTLGDKAVVGRVENVYLLPKQIKLKAKIDTGAKTSSLHAINLTEFERDGKDWVRFAMLHPKTKQQINFERAVVRKTKVKQQESGLQHRPTILMTVKLGQMEEQVEFTLTDRSGYLYQVLIGRNVLRDRFVVDVSRTFLSSTTLINATE